MYPLNKTGTKYYVFLCSDLSEFSLTDKYLVNHLRARNALSGLDIHISSLCSFYRQFSLSATMLGVRSHGGTYEIIFELEQKTI